MQEQPAELQRINWSSCFAFTQIFRTFKMALHPSKLGLALAAVLLTFALGKVLDRVWSSRYEPVANEVNAFWLQPNIDRWRDERLAHREAAVRSAYQQLDLTIPPDVVQDLKASAVTNATVRSALNDIETKGRARVYDAKTRAEDRPQIAAEFTRVYEGLEQFRTRGVFTSFIDFETSAIRQFVNSAATLRLGEGVQEVMTARRADGFTGVLGSVRSPLGAGVALKPTESGVGALASLILMARGVQWLVLEHALYALVFLLVALAIWAFFGGAICRMAALNFARDERIPLRTAWNFACRKYVGFVTAPLLPVGLIVGAGVFLAIGGLIGSIPYAGGAIAGLFLFLALAAGFVMALVTIGFLVGGSLMWPTIAVEGSDSFDAMSRSYSYIYSRPWKTALYALVVCTYGAICYLFARFFVYLMLRISRFFVGLGMTWTSRPGTGTPGSTRIDSLWPLPTFDELLPSPPLFAAWHGDTAGQWLVALWVGLTMLLLCAFLVTFYFCGSTIIYYLLRREVDATDLEDVYSEDVDEEEAKHGAAVADTPAAPATAGASATSSESPTPPAEAGEMPSRA
jgi:hypothetical protein